MDSKTAQRVIQKASQALAEYCMRHELHATVTGISGGLDSAVTLGLSQKAVEYARSSGFEMRSIGLILPCHSDPEHGKLGKKVISTFGAELLEIDLSEIFDQIEKKILKPIESKVQEYRRENSAIRFRTAQGNMKARLRMALGTYAVANLINGLVLSTDNYSEYWMGFWTLHGDVGDFGMIQEIWKSDELPVIARELGVPEEVITAMPTDGLGIVEGGDEAQMGAPYIVVDQILRALIKEGIDLNGSVDQLRKLPAIIGIDPDLVKKVAARSIKNAFKRKNPITLKRKMLDIDI